MNNKNLIYLPFILGIILVIGLVAFFVLPGNKSKTALNPSSPNVSMVDTSTDKDILPESKLRPGGATDSKPAQINPKVDSSSNTMTAEQVATHKDAQSCYVIYQQDIYDLTSYIGRHEGGDQPILDNCGKTIDSLSQIHPGGNFSSPKVQAAIRGLVIGKVK